jgi:hypothetical protein
MSPDGAYGEEMNDVSQFMNAMRAAVVAEPDPRIGADLVPRLAAAARASTIEAETRATRRSPRSRLGMLARVGIAVAAIPLLFAGLAVAGVTVPHVARSAFERVGIELPNQPATNASTERSEQDASGTDATKETTTVSGKGNSHAAHQHALQQRQKAKGRARGHEIGKAIGLNESTPPGLSGETGAPEHSNAGGSAQSQTAPGRVKVPGPPHPPKGNSGAHGQ